MTLDGQPFTGVTYCTYPDGQLSYELTMVNGLPKGLCREWHPNGQLSHEWIAQHGCGPDKLTTWHENGVLASVKRAELGVETEYNEWDESGQLQVHRVLEPGSTLHTLLLQLRERKARGPAG
ncbi:toxin-antitoxin system YwqK family antitoxin [Montanilutibacter psychrotolerans]|nr:hypothetical protein [Lysobacter psychrotolerans]